MLRRNEFGPDGPKWGPRHGVPVAVVNLDEKDRINQQEDAAYRAATSAIPGVPLADNPLDIRSPEDLKTIGRAVKSRWNIPDSVRESVVSEMAKIVDAEDADPSHKIAAARVLVTADKINVQIEHPQDQVGSGVTVNILTPDAAKQLSAEELDRRLKALEDVSPEGERVQG